MELPLKTIVRRLFYLLHQYCNTVFCGNAFFSNVIDMLFN